MKQTAVEWIEKQLIEGTMRPVEIIAIAKAMEKEQIFEAWDNGFANGYDLGKYNDECSPEDAQKYYTETYESKTNL